MAQLLAARSVSAAAKRRLGSNVAFTTARRFAGDGFASIADTAALRTPTTACTVAGWVKLQGLGDSFAALVMKQYATSSPWLSYAIQSVSPGEMRFRISDGTTGYNTATLAALPTGVWMYLAGRWESGGLMTLDYFNAAGTLVEQVDSTTTVTATIGYANFPLVFGVDAVAPASGIPCDLAGWLVHDDRLSDAQLTTHRDGTWPLSTSAGQWRLGVSDPETDASGNGLALTLSQEVLQSVAGPDDTTGPSISAVGSSGVGGAFATVAWTTDENADSEVEYGLTTGYGTSVTDTALTTSHSLQITGLSASTEYHYRVLSADSNGNQTTSADGTFTTSAPSVPSAPTNVVAVAGDTQVSVGWGAVAGADTYTVYRSLTSGSGFASVQTGLVGTSWVDTGRTNDTEYFYKVTAVNATGESADSTEVSATPVAAGVVAHGEDLTRDDVGLIGAGYTYDSGTDTYTHPTYGALTPTGGYTVSANGEVVEGLDIDGGINLLSYSNVIIRRCRISAAGGQIKMVRASDAYGLTLEDCKLRTTGTLQQRAEATAVHTYQGGLTARRNDIEGFKVGIQTYGTNILIEQNVIWNPQKVSGTHGTASSHRGQGDITYRENYLVGNASSCVAFYADFEPMDNVTVERNYFTAVDLPGGDFIGTPSYLLNAGNKPGAAGNTNFTIVDNVFFRTQAGAGGDWPNGGQYGAVQNGGSVTGWPGSVSSNNLWNDGATAYGDFGPV